MGGYSKLGNGHFLEINFKLNKKVNYPPTQSGPMGFLAKNIMKIDELRAYAEENGFDDLEFEFTNLLGEVKKCKWLDAYLVFFKIDGGTGFITVDQWKKITGDVFEFKLIS